MISSADLVQNGSSRGNNDDEPREIFSEFSSRPTSTPIADVNNDRGRQTLFSFPHSLPLSLVFICEYVTKFAV